MIKRIDVNDFNRIYEKIKLICPAYRIKSFDEYKACLEGNNYQCFVFEEAGKVLGFVMGYIFQNDKAKAYPKRYGFFHLDYIIIYEEYRNLGYGTQFMKELLNEPFTKKGIFFALPMENNYKDDKNDPYFERIGNDPYYKIKRFFDRFSQIEITHFQNDKKFVYMYPGSDKELHPMHLHFIKGFDRNEPKEFRVYYDEFASLLKESEDFIHQNNPLKEEAYASYKNTIVKTTAPTDIPAIHYELFKINTDYDRMVEDIKTLVINGDKMLSHNLFNDGNLAFDTFKAMLLKNTVFNKDNILAMYFGDGGIFYDISQAIVFLEKYPENNKEEMLKAFKETLADVPLGFDKAIEYLEKFRTKMNEGERRILFISKGNSYYSFTSNESNLLTKLPKGYTYVIEVKKDDLFRVLDFTKLGFKIRKEYKDTIELCKKI